MMRMNEVLDAVSKVDAVKLRELAGYFSDEAAVSQEGEAIELALVTYCLHKVFIKVHMREKTEELVESMLRDLSGGNIRKALEDIGAFDETHGLFEGGIVGKARIKIASRLYSRGISATQSSSLTGASVGDILGYIGDTKSYQHKSEKTVAERLNVARDILR